MERLFKVFMVQQDKALSALASRMDTFEASIGKGKAPASAPSLTMDFPLPSHQDMERLVSGVSKPRFRPYASRDENPRPTKVPRPSVSFLVGGSQDSQSPSPLQNEEYEDVDEDLELPDPLSPDDDVDEAQRFLNSTLDPDEDSMIRHYRRKDKLDQGPCLRDIEDKGFFDAWITSEDNKETLRLIPQLSGTRNISIPQQHADFEGLLLVDEKSKLKAKDDPKVQASLKEIKHHFTDLQRLGLLESLLHELLGTSTPESRRVELTVQLPAVLANIMQAKTYDLQQATKKARERYMSLFPTIGPTGAAAYVHRVKVGQPNELGQTFLIGNPDDFLGWHNANATRISQLVSQTHQTSLFQSLLSQSRGRGESKNQNTWGRSSSRGGFRGSGRGNGRGGSGQQSNAGRSSNQYQSANRRGGRGRGNSSQTYQRPADP